MCHVERKRPTLSKETFEASYAPQLDHTVKVALTLEVERAGTEKPLGRLLIRVAGIVDSLKGWGKWIQWKE